jgi:predicted dinucleotide-binding enzyme
MTTIGISGAGELGSHIARAASQLGPTARAATAVDAATAGDFVVVAVPLKLVNDMPVNALAGKVVIDTNNYMPWRDGNYAVVDSGEKTEHQLRQEQLAASKIVKAFTHIQAPRILTWGQPAGSPDRLALSVSSDFPEAVAIVTRLYDQFGFDTVDNSPLSESWRTRPGQPAWKQSAQTRSELVDNLARASRSEQSLTS